MTEQASAQTIWPLLEVAGTHANLTTRLEALDVATRLPLNEQAWSAVAVVTWGVVLDAEPGSMERVRALAIAARIPLLSLRSVLREIAADSDDPDAEALQRTLAEAHDPSQAQRVLDEARQGSGEAFGKPAFELLAAMPLEDADIAPDDIASISGEADAESDVWRALALARLGRFEAIDALLEAPIHDVPMFWGDPWTPYNRIAAVRPLPPQTLQHLLDAHSEGRTSELGRRIIWAVTGIASATGSPIDEQEEAPAEPAAEAPAPTPQQMMEARVVADRVLASLNEERPPALEDLDALDHLPPDEAGSFVLSLITAANRIAVGLAPDDPRGFLLGNQILDIVVHLRASEAWPVAELFDRFPRIAVLDSDQMAWVIARAPTERIVAEMASRIRTTVTTKGPERGRREPAALLAPVADTLAGRAGSPWRGAGPGGRDVLARPALIDDRPERAAIGPDRRALEEPAVAEQRRVHAQIRHEGLKRHTFVAGADNVVRCWIGLPEPEAGAVADQAIPDLDLPPEGIILDAVLRWKDHTDCGTLHLPGDRTARSSECDFHIPVPDDERFVSAEIAFLYRGRAFEVVHVEAFVLPPEAAEQPHHTVDVRVQVAQRQVVELPDSNRVDAVMIYGEDRTRVDRPQGQGPTTLQTYSSSSGASFDLKDPDEMIDYLNTELFVAGTSLVRRRARAGRTDEVLDTGDSDVLRILRTLARHGAALYNSLGQEFKDPGPRIQLQNQDPREYSPIEFVYDRGFPADEAVICQAGLAALGSDAANCPHCPPADELSADLRDWNPTICPFGFWSLQKIIERRDPLDHEEDAADGVSFPLPGRRHLPPIDSVLFASSSNVDEADQTETWESLQEAVPRAVRAASWREWKSTLADTRHALLLALPHHGVEDGLDFLEIGDEQLPKQDRRLSRGRLTELYTNPGLDQPGPIVLLLGCRTGTATELGYVAMARRFQKLSTSIVLGTLAKVLGRHAAPVAREIVAQLAAVDDPDTDFGTIMQRVRRRMLARGYLMALCLVALGDGEWRLTPRT